MLCLCSSTNQCNNIRARHIFWKVNGIYFRSDTQYWTHLCDKYSVLNCVLRCFSLPLQPARSLQRLPCEYFCELVVCSESAPKFNSSSRKFLRENIQVLIILLSCLYTFMGPRFHILNFLFRYAFVSSRFHKDIEQYRKFNEGLQTWCFRNSSYPSWSLGI